MDFPDYTHEVVKFYKHLKDKHLLRDEMVELSPAELKSMCLSIYNKRYRKNDEGVIEGFFGEAVDEKARIKSIEKCPIDKFRPLINYLKGDSKTTHYTNIKLLAWMIDFPVRPFVNGNKASLTWLREEAATALDKLSRGEEYEVSVYEIQNGGGKSKEKPDLDRKPSASKKVIVTLAITITLVLGTYVIWKLVWEEKGCMYWNGVRYEKIMCDPSPNTALVIKFDSDRYNSLRRITDLRSLNKRSIGHVWYAKIQKDSFEFFTANGFHPVYTNFRLKPLSDYILEEHVFKPIASRDSVARLSDIKN